MRRYGNFDYISALPFAEGAELLKFAEEQENEEKIFLRWVVGYQTTTAYGDFKNKLLKNCRYSDNKTEAQILDNVSDIIERFNNGI